jgi:TRAP-type mannitol/chloroaromatic compound transport system substrate-binding protein
VLQKQLEVYDQVTAKKAPGTPMFQEIMDSQKKFAERAVKWEQDVVVNRRMAYDHYFGKKSAGKKA